MMKLLRGLSILAILSCFTLGIYGRQQFNHICYSDYLESSLYLQNLNINPDPEAFIKEQSIEKIEDLINQSDYVFKVKVTEDILFKDATIINYCDILETIKTVDDLEKKHIGIYQSVIHWTNYGTNFISKQPPLKVGEEYYVFLNKTIRGVKDTFYFSSLEYGWFRSDSTFHYLDNYNNDHTMGMICEYDGVNFTENEKLKYKNLYFDLKKY